MTLDITRLKSLILKVIKLKPREVCQVTQGQNELIQIYCSLGNCAPSLSRGRGWPCVCVSVCVCFVCVFTLHHPLWMLGDKPVASHWQGSCSPQAFPPAEIRVVMTLQGEARPHRGLMKQVVPHRLPPRPAWAWLSVTWAPTGRSSVAWVLTLRMHGLGFLSLLCFDSLSALPRPCCVSPLLPSPAL